MPIELLLTDLLAVFAIYLIINLSLNLEFGYAGIPNFGKVLAVASGAFVVGFFPGRLVALLLDIDISMYVEDNARIVALVTRELQDNVLLALVLTVITLVLAAAVGAAIGFITSYPAIRLREDFLAMTLLAMGEGIRIVGSNYPP